MSGQDPRSSPSATSSALWKPRLVPLALPFRQPSLAQANSSSLLHSAAQPPIQTCLPWSNLEVRAKSKICARGSISGEVQNGRTKSISMVQPGGIQRAPNQSSRREIQLSLVLFFSCRLFVIFTALRITMMLLHLFEAGAIFQSAAVHKSQAASLHLPPGYQLYSWTRPVFMCRNKAIHHLASRRNGQQQGRCGAPALQINRFPARLPGEWNTTLQIVPDEERQKLNIIRTIMTRINLMPVFSALTINLKGTFFADLIVRYRANGRVT